jgi:hypothetical protein
MEDGYIFQTFWTPFLAYSLLLAVYIIILGIALAGLAAALRAREREAGRAFNRPER